VNRLQILSTTDAKAIHEASLRVLETTGIDLDHPRVEALLLEHGARQDGDGRILLPRELVEAALEGIPRGFEMFDRDGQPAMTVEAGRSYFGPGSDALQQRDLATGELRESRLDDVGANVQIADALGYDFVMSMALPRDLDTASLYPRVFTEIVGATSRPVVFTAISARNVQDIHRIAEIAAGGAERLRARPFLLAYVEPVSPLRFDRACVDKLAYCAEHDIPFAFAAGANCGIGAPITPEGGVVQGGAESLAGLVIAQLLNPRARFVYGSNTSSADMRSGLVCYGAPEWFRTVAMYADMGRFYGLPSWGTAGCTDAQRVDAQAAWEATRGILLALGAGATIVHDMGYMAFGELYDMRMLALAMEILRETRQLTAPPDLSADALSVEIIDEVSRGASLYLAHPHTRRNFRQSLWMSPVPNRVKAGQPDEEIGDRLARQVDRAVDRHQPTTLDAERKAAVEEYLEGRCRNEGSEG